MASLAQRILHGKTPYAVAKRAISTLFSVDTSLPRLEQLCLRLTVIDSYYSTNMSKRYYGVEDVGSALQSLRATDTDLVGFFLDYIKSPLASSEGRRLFEMTYGMDKHGRSSKRAQSLISKYAYFLTNYQFPIFDTLARQSYVTLSKAFPDQVDPCVRPGQVGHFFASLSVLNESIGSFDALDNLLWLMGKVVEGNLSLILPRDNYLRLINHCKGPTSLSTLCRLASIDSNGPAILGEDLCTFVGLVAAADTTITRASGLRGVAGSSHAS